jgi:hypothetical protein
VYAGGCLSGPCKDASMREIEATVAEMWDWHNHKTEKRGGLRPRFFFFVYGIRKRQVDPKKGRRGQKKMATSGIVVAAVLLFVIGIIILVVVLATSAGSGSTSGSGSGVSPTGALAPPGSAGNWTPAQVATQAALLSASTGADMFTKLGYTKPSLDTLFACAMKDFSTRHGYDHVNNCNSNIESPSAGCKATWEDKLAYMRCMGGGERGNWTDQMKTFLKDAPRNAGTTDEAAAEAHWPCVVDFLADNYSFFDALNELGRTADLDDAAALNTPIAKAAVACSARGISGSAGNWTAEQLGEQARLFGALEAMSQLRANGFTATFIAEVSECAMRAASNVYTYEYMNNCNTGTACAFTDQDIRTLSTCIGGVKGNWTPKLKNLMIAGGRLADLGADLSAIYPCVVDWLESQYDFFGALGALSTATQGSGAVYDKVREALDKCESARIRT